MSFAIARAVSVLCLLVSLAFGWPVGLLAQQPAQPKVTLQVKRGHANPEVVSAAFSPDGTKLLTSSISGEAILWDAASGRTIWRVSAAGVAPTLSRFGNEDWSTVGAAFSKDGSKVLLAGPDHSTLLCDVAGGNKLQSFRGHKMELSFQAFSPDDSKVVTGSEDTMAIVWDAASGRQLQAFHFVNQVKPQLTRGMPTFPPPPPNPASELAKALAFSADGAKLFAVSDDDNLLEWDVATGRQLQKRPLPVRDFEACAFSPDRSALAIGTRDGVAHLYDLATLKELNTYNGHRERIGAVRFSHDGTRLATSAESEDAIVWDAAKGTQLQTIQGAGALALNADGTKAVIVDLEGEMALWDVEKKKKLHELKTPAAELTALAVSGDGTRIVTAGEDGVTMWDTARGQLVANRAGDPKTDSGLALDAVVNADGTRVLFRWHDGGSVATLWDPVNGKDLETFNGADGWVLAAAFAPDGIRIVTSSKDIGINLRDASNGRILQTLEGNTTGFGKFTISPDGKQVVAIESSASAVLWDVASSRPRVLQTFAHSGPFNRNPTFVLSAGFSPDGKKIVTVSSNDRAATAILWDAVSGKQLQSFVSATRDTTCAVCSPDGTQVLTTANKAAAALWDAATGKQLREFPASDGPTEALAFTPDGTKVLIGSIDGIVSVWNAATGAELARLIKFEGGKDWIAYTPQGYYVGSKDVGNFAHFSDGQKIYPLDKFPEFNRPDKVAEALKSK